MTIEGLFDRVEPLDPDRRDALHAACRSMGLSDGAIEGVEEAARMLREFELYEKEFVQTPGQRVQTLQEVADLSRNLSIALSRLSTFDKVILHGHMEDAGLPDGLPFPQNAPVPGMAWYFQVALGGLVEAVRLTCDEAPALRKGGRKILKPHYYKFIDWLWWSVKDEDQVNLTRGGKFERIADAVFLAAGVPAAAAGAVRYYVDVRKAKDAVGPDNDW